jgi:endonuclease/exonuclease/phosphatase (EEP) superfamily protein YafD
VRTTFYATAPKTAFLVCMTLSRRLHACSLALLATLPLVTPGSHATADDKPIPLELQPTNFRRFDVTTPTVRLTSIGLATELDHGADAGVVAAGAIAPGQDALITAQAFDAATGVSSVELYGELRAFCGQTSASVEKLERAVMPLEQLTVAPADAAGFFPNTYTASVLVPFGKAAGLCAARGLRLVDAEAELHSEAINGAGISSADVSTRIAYGPQRLKVSIHNAFAPCLRELEDIFGSELSYRNVCESAGLPFWATISDPPRRPTMASVMQLWGSEFAKQDLTFVNEVTDPRWVTMMMQFMPGFHVAQHGMTVIFSRFPITDIRNDIVTTLFWGQGVGPFFVSSEYVRATVLANGRPMVAYAVHWAHRPTPPETSADNRLVLAERIAADIAQIDPHVPVLVGGDFNSKSASTVPGDLDATRSVSEVDEFARFTSVFQGSMPEIATMERTLRLARIEVFQTTDRSRFTTMFPRTPVDHLFLRGEYHAKAYSDAAPASPSDHPRLTFELERGF